MKKLLPKGYRIEVHSYEGDGDNVSTESITVNTKECAKAIHKLCTEVFDGFTYTIEEWVKLNPENLEIIKNELDLNYEDDEDIIYDLERDLMNISEYKRYCNSCEVFFVKEDVFVEEIVF